MPLKLKKFIKALFRSKSLDFAIEYGGGNTAKSVKQLRWNSFSYYYRTGTSDAFVAYECFLHGKRNAYLSPHLPSRSNVKTIIDVGANVGASVLFWRHMFPDAAIYCFEPIASNFEMLKRNCEGLPNVHMFNEALGAENGTISFIHSPGGGNEGGWSIFQRGARGDEQKISVPLRRSGERLLELGIERIDVLKVDTEGAEKMIIQGLGDSLLASTQYICGELHGERDFELLDFLECNGFYIGAKKSPKSTLFNFEALKR